MFHSVEPLFRPKSVAIVGASESGGAGWSRQVFENLEFAGFPTRLYLVNPRRDELWGQPVYPDFAALPEPIDLALTIIPAETIPDALRQGVESGLKSALIYAARFGEGGDAVGAERAQAVKALSERHGLRVCGPNCMGSISVRERMLFYPAPRVRDLPAGPVGVVFQSGGTFQYWLQQAALRGLGYSYAVSSGNELDLDIADYINFMVEDPETRLIACMVEGIRRPEAFMAAAEKALAAAKPVVVVKIGRSERGRDATRSHTGALAGDDDVFDAVCRKYGVTRCASLDDLIETCLAFQAGRIPDGPRVVMAGYSGGAKGLLLDYASAEGMPLAELEPATMEALRPLLDPGLKPGNPLDTGAGLAGQPAKFAEICGLLARDGNVDLVSVQGQLPMTAEERQDAQAFKAALESGKPVVAHGRMAQNVTEAGRAFQDRAGVPFLQGLPETVRALKALADYGGRRRNGVPPMPSADGRAGDLDGAAFEALLAANGLPPPRGAFAATAEEAASRAAAIGFPVALKIVSPEASHKTEIGGVALDLLDEIAVRAEADAMRTRLATANPGATVTGYLVQEMVDGLEVILGVREDKQFGPFMVVGLGGVFVEALNDVAFRLLPVSADDGSEMLAALRGRALLGAFRGRPARDVDAVAAAIEGLSRIFLDHRNHLSDLEINPLIVLAEGAGVRAVDVRPVRRDQVVDS